MAKSKPQIDLAKLTREEKLALLDTLSEKERRNKRKRGVYKPNTGQLPVHSCNKPFRAVFSGNGAGKTALLVNEVLWAALGYNPILKTYTKVPSRIAVVLDLPKKLEDKWLPEIRKWYPLEEEQCHKDGKPHVSRISFPNGSVVSFYFHEQNPMAFESIEVDWAGFDEPPPKYIFHGLVRGGREKGSDPRYLIVGTPLAAPWLRTEVYDPWARGEAPDTECFRFDSDVNKDNLNWEAQERFFAKLSPQELEIRRRGAFHDLEGLALSSVFRRASHIVTRKELRWDHSNPCVLVFDPHPSKPHHAVVLGVDRDGRYVVLDEYKERTVARTLIRSLIDLKWFDRYRFVDIVWDSLGSSATTSGEGLKSFGEVVNEELAKHRLGRGRATRYDEKSDEAFIDGIQEALAIPPVEDSFGRRTPKLRIVDECKGSISDIENVQWTRDKRSDTNKPKLDISNKDFLSCIKYALASAPSPLINRARIIKAKGAVSWSRR